MPPNPLTSLSVLIVEDEPLLRKQLTAYLERQGADVTAVESIQKVKQLAEHLSFDFVLLDVNLPDGRGTDLLRDKIFSGTTGVIVMTAEGAISGAVEAMRLGALDYLAKPFDPVELPIVIARARRVKQTERLEEQKRNDAVQSRDTFFFGSSLAKLEGQLQKILAADQRLETHLAPVLIEGETGTGKTTIARWIHHQGPRASQPLVEVNCSALPETLAESELFGHERGAFTDARSTRMGLFEAANGGTLFLDEAPSLSGPLQAKILTAIEDHRIRRIGGNKEIPVDVRIIAATNRDLKTLVADRQFREDLYHRLDLFRIVLPPLRRRGDDLIKLADRLLEQICRRHRVPPKSFDAVGRQNLLSYHWPGNVRELAHELERAVVFEESDPLRFETLIRAPLETAPSAAPALSPAEWLNPGFSLPPEGFYLEEAINRLIQLALKQTHNNVSAAGRLLGVSRDYVRYRLYGQKAEGKPKDEDAA